MFHDKVVTIKYSYHREKESNKQVPSKNGRRSERGCLGSQQLYVFTAVGKEGGRDGSEGLFRRGPSVGTWGHVPQDP